MRRVRTYEVDDCDFTVSPDSWRGCVVIEKRNLRLMRAVVRAVEWELRRGRGLNANLYDAWCAFNAPEKRKP